MGTPFLLLKSPRSGSTYLNNVLKNQNSVYIDWETPHFERSVKMCSMTSRYRACGASINDMLKDKSRTDKIFHVFKLPNIKIIIQLRLNVVEKAFSAYRLFDPRFRQNSRSCIRLTEYLKKQACYEAIAVDPSLIAHSVVSGWSTMKAHIAASKYIEKHLGLTPLFVWYEDLVRSPQKTWNVITKYLDIPSSTLTRFPRNFRLLNCVNIDEVKRALNSDEFKKMLDIRWSMSVNTTFYYNKIYNMVNPEISYNHW